MLISYDTLNVKRLKSQKEVTILLWEEEAWCTERSQYGVVSGNN